MQAINKLAICKQFNVFRTLTSGLHTTRSCLKAEDRKEMLASLPAKDEGVEGERAINIDQLIQK
jgi:small subunit ribosomal protein S11